MSRDYIDNPDEDAAFSLRRISSTLDDIHEVLAAHLTVTFTPSSDAAAPPCDCVAGPWRDCPCCAPPSDPAAPLREALLTLRIAAVEVVIEATSDGFDPSTREWGELIEQLESAALAPAPKEADHE